MISPAERLELAPTGKLRVGIMYTNPVIAAKDPVTGVLTGISVDLAHEFARRVGVPLELMGYETTAAMLDDLHTDVWDVAFTAISSGHAADLEFTLPYLETEGTFLVPPGSSIKAISDMDRSGLRIAVSAHSSLDQHLTSTLERAKLVRIPGAPAAFELLRSGRADALAGLRQQLAKVALRLPGSRILDGRFMVIYQGVAVPKGRKAGAARLHEFVEKAKAKGLVLELIRKNGLAGVVVAGDTSAGP